MEGLTSYIKFQKMIGIGYKETIVNTSYRPISLTNKALQYSEPDDTIHEYYHYTKNYISNYNRKIGYRLSEIKNIP